jgi:hypothetical protein
MKDDSGVLVLSEKPISGKLITDQFQEQLDLKSFM